MADRDGYVVRWRETNRLTHELLVMRRYGGVVKYLEPVVVGMPTADQPPVADHLEWRWVRSEPGVHLEPGQGVALEVPSEALEAIRSALEATLGIPPATAEARVLRAAWENERGYVRQLLDMVAETVKRSPIVIHGPDPEGP